MNDFALQGGALAIAGWAAYRLQGIGSWISQSFRRRVTTTLTIQSDSQKFIPVLAWLSKRLHNHRDLQPGENGKLVIAPGWSWLWYKRRPMLINYHREKATGSRSIDLDTVYISMIGLGRTDAESLMTEAIEESVDKSMKKVYVSDGWGFSERQIPKRDISTVILPGDVGDDIIEDLQRFLDSEEWYATHGVPYRRGYLLEGLPGTGKSSLALALATKLDLPVYLPKLSGTSDSQLRETFGRIPKQSIVLIEDVDCVSPATQSREVKDEDTKPIIGLSLSGLLNAIDGLEAPHGIIFIFTTNNADNIDSALLRPGRVDRRIKFTNLDQSQAERMVDRFGITGEHRERLIVDAITKQMTACMLQEKAIECLRITR